jgi:serine/threonine protein kinase
MLGKGGMGSIWEVEDSRLERRVALKVLHSGAEVIEEARIAATLEHPGIAPIYETGTLADGRSYYTMRLLRGKTVAEAIHASMPMRERLRLWLAVAEALDFAHSRGVHHRDLKPDNVLAGDYGEVVVLDWGIAERGEGEPRSDLEALGRLLSFCLPTDAPRPLLAIAKANYGSAREAIEDVSRWQDGAPVSVYQEAWWERISRWGKNNQVLLLLLAAYALTKLFLVFLRWT